MTLIEIKKKRHRQKFTAVVRIGGKQGRKGRQMKGRRKRIKKKGGGCVCDYLERMSLGA